MTVKSSSTLTSALGNFHLPLLVSNIANKQSRRHQVTLAAEIFCPPRHKGIELSPQQKTKTQDEPIETKQVLRGQLKLKKLNQSQTRTLTPKAPLSVWRTNGISGRYLQSEFIS